MKLVTNALINEVDYPEKACYFKELDFSDFLLIPDEDPDVENVNAIKIWCDISNFKIVETEVGISNEGQVLTGKNLHVAIRINEKITYSAKDRKMPLNIIYNEYYKSDYIIVPQNISELDIDTLKRSGRIVVTPYVENIYGRKFNNRSIYKNISIFLDVRIC